MILSLALTLAACGSTPLLPQPDDYPRLSVKDDEENTLSFADPKARFENYGKLYIAPIKIQHGNSQAMQDVTTKEAQNIAHYMEKKLKATLSREFEIVNQSGPDVITMRFRIMDLEPTSAAQVAMMVPPFALINLVSSKGAFIGSITMAGEFYEGLNKRSSATFIAFRSRPWRDIKSVFGRWTAVENIIDQAADRLTQDFSNNRKAKRILINTIRSRSVHFDLIF